MYVYAYITVYTTTPQSFNPKPKTRNPNRTKIFTESSGCQIRLLKTSGYRPRLTQMGGTRNVI